MRASCVLEGEGQFIGMEGSLNGEGIAYWWYWYSGCTHVCMLGGVVVVVVGGGKERRL